MRIYEDGSYLGLVPGLFTQMLPIIPKHLEWHNTDGPLDNNYGGFLIICLASSHLLPTVHILNTSLSHYPFHPNSAFPLPVLTNHPLDPSHHHSPNHPHHNPQHTLLHRRRPLARRPSLRNNNGRGRVGSGGSDARGSSRLDEGGRGRQVFCLCVGGCQFLISRRGRGEGGGANRRWWCS